MVDTILIGMIDFVSGVVLTLILTRLFKKKKNVSKQTKEARETLRRIYLKYQKELHEVVMKIDRMLEVLEE